MEQWTVALVYRLKEGDRQAFDELMEHFYLKLLRMAYLIQAAMRTARTSCRRPLFSAGSTGEGSGSRSILQGGFTGP